MATQTFKKRSEGKITILRRVEEAALAYLGKPWQVRIWMNLPNLSLDMMTPRHYIAIGRGENLLRLIENFREQERKKR